MTKLKTNKNFIKGLKKKIRIEIEIKKKQTFTF